MPGKLHAKFMRTLRRYQLKHPEPDFPGRIRADKRHGFHKEAAGIITPDREISRILAGATNISDLQKSEKIAERLLSKHSNDPKAALKELDGIIENIIQTMHFPESGRIFDEVPLKKHAREKGYAVWEYLDQNTHMHKAVFGEGFYPVLRRAMPLIAIRALKKTGG